MAHIGYIGLGLMGSGIARNLMKAGHTLIVHNRSRAIVDQFAHEGAIPALSPREVAEQSEFVFTNLPDTPDVEQVVLGSDGIIEGAHQGLVARCAGQRWGHWGAGGHVGGDGGGAKRGV
jgi:3-hydroxyisobutyrate dehydrogenase-like beta-hydroxyacid dehydrogenase